MTDDSIFELEKDYYLGNYQSCNNKANSMPASRESMFYMCLSYYHLKKLDILALEMGKSSEQCVELIGKLVTYSEQVSQRETILNELEHLLQDKSALNPKDDLSRLIVSSIFVRAKKYPEALKALHQLDSLPALLAKIGVYISMNRFDLAEQALKTMQNAKDYSTLTLLASAQLRLASGNAREAHDTAKELEDVYRATPLIKNIQTAAAVSLGNYDLAQEHCKSAMDLDNDNLEALINMIHILSKLRASTEIKERHYGRLKAMYPDNEIVKEVEKIASVCN